MMQSVGCFLRLLAVSAALFAASAQAQERSIQCPEQRVPEWVRSVVVAQSMTMNNIPTAIRELHGTRPLGDLLAYFRDYWKSRPKGFREVAEGDWVVLSSFEGECFYTLQARTRDKGVYALLSVTRRAGGASRSTLGQGIPMPSGSKVVTDIRHRDMVKTGRSVTLVNTMSLDGNIAYYRGTLRESGWVNVMENTVPMKEGGLAQVMLFKKGMQEIGLSMTNKNGQTVVMVTTMDNP